MEKYLICGPDWEEEALYLLGCMAGAHLAEGFAAECDHLAEKLPTLQATLLLCKEAAAAVETACTLTPAEKDLFAPCSAEGIDFTPAELLRRMARSTEASAEQRCLRLCDALEVYDLPSEPGAFLAALEGQPVTLREKWLCVQALYGLEAAAAQVQEPILRAVAALRPYQARLLGAAEDWRARIEPQLRTGGLDRLLASSGVKLDDGHPLRIVPGLFACRSLTMYSDELDAAQDQRVTFRLGIFVDEICDVNARKESDEADVLRFVHALDDASRLAILRSLRAGPHNGRELSALTGLSPATISHHMNELVSADLVTMEKKGASILYAGDGRSMTRALALLEEQLAPKG